MLIISQWLHENKLIPIRFWHKLVSSELEKLKKEIIESNNVRLHKHEFIWKLGSACRPTKALANWELFLGDPKCLKINYYELPWDNKSAFAFQWFELATYSFSAQYPNHCTIKWCSTWYKWIIFIMVLTWLHLPRTMYDWFSFAVISDYGSLNSWIKFMQYTFR